MQADEAHGSSHEFREGLAKRNPRYSLAGPLEHDGLGAGAVTFATQTLEGGGGPKATRIRCDEARQPYTAEQLARALPENVWREVSCREGSKTTLRFRFAAPRVRPAYGDDRSGGLRPEPWLLMEWPAQPAGCAQKKRGSRMAPPLCFDAACEA